MADTFLYEHKIGLLIWKTSNFWQSKIRKILSPFKISLNEYLILQAIKLLHKNKSNVYQNEIANFIGIDVSVTSVTLKLLESKNCVSRSLQGDNRKKIINTLEFGDKLFEKIHPLVKNAEEQIFNKLNNETFNFTNSLKLLLGKKIRIKAEKEY